jgi:hypothetical protein
VAIAVALLAMAAACAGDDGDDHDRSAETTMTTSDRPDGPSAELTELTGGQGIDLVSTHPPELEAAGFEESEWMASGTAASYEAIGELPGDGTFELAPGVTDGYATRIVVRRPSDPADFNGTVLVEWLNVSGGIDASPDWTYAAAEVLRGGYVWVGVSAQMIGVQGGQAAIDIAAAPKGGVKAADPERYGGLSHPGDAFAFDIYTQVGRALRRAGDDGPLAGLQPERVLAIGESQSAFMLTTYVNGVQPLTKAFDGFLVHSRGGAAGPLGEPGKVVDLVSSIGGPATQIRTDGEAPVIVVQMEGDLLGVIGYAPARQPDSERFRLWEVAGAAHADAFQVGAAADLFDCGGAINDGPQRFVVRSAIRHLDRWVRTGDAPPEAPRIEIEERAGGLQQLVRDEHGNVEGGIRTPPVDVPAAVLSGEPWPGSDILCILFGRTEPFSRARFRELYGDHESYLEAYEASADEAIAAGWVLEEDREDLMTLAAPPAD